MHLEVSVPYGVFADETAVRRIVIHTPGGSFGLLPHRLDCVANLAPGILIYQGAGAEVCIAVDEGVLVKTGADVRVSVRRAIAGEDLGQLREAVRREFLQQDQASQSLRAAMVQLENGFLMRFAGFRHG